MSHTEIIASELKLHPQQVQAVVTLLDSGNTIPFIARYRKEATGSLDEVQIRQIAHQLAGLRRVDERRQSIIRLIDAQNKMTGELRRRLLAAQTMTVLEDLYQPFKKKRKTRASIARENGLEPLAELILEQARLEISAERLAESYISDSVPTVEAALAGARDIVAEQISDDADVRQRVRDKAMRWGIVRCRRNEKVEDKRSIYKLYYDFQLRVEKLRPHQILAINRGEAEKVLRVKLEMAEKDWLLPMRTVFRPDFRRSPLAEQMRIAMYDAAERLILPAIERDVRRSLTERAEAHAIQVFSDNLRGLLSQPPLLGHTILAIDPGFRAGCKLAVVDSTGKVLDTVTIYPHQPQKRRDEALKCLAQLVDRHGVSLVAIGNGTASRETEQLVAELTRRLDRVHYLVVNEAGASVYSASKLAGAELPGMDVTLRGAVSIGRRVIDPLAELVKIDPKSIGVGMYQHDVNQGRLSEALHGVVESVVNQVGVDANTASPALLTHISGVGPKLAERIVAFRNENGPFLSREMLKEVHGLGSKAFEQSAGFLRIRDGMNPFDATAIHPESYGVAESLLQLAGLQPSDSLDQRERALAELHQTRTLEELAMEMKIGLPTLEDIWEQLLRPGRDPREDMPSPMLRDDIMAMADLQEGMQLKGTVRNVVDFGAFVDIGVKQDGLLHRSQIPRRVQLNVGEAVEVRILKVESERGRISLGWSRNTAK